MAGEDQPQLVRILPLTANVIAVALEFPRIMHSAFYQGNYAKKKEEKNESKKN